MAEAIRVNFGRPMPVFPLPGAVLLPHALQPLHIFEQRYRQMVADSLDGLGQIAMACFTSRDRQNDECPLRPAVCVGQIVRHEARDDDHFDIWMQGICRARILRVHEAADDRLYRRVDLEPLEKITNEPPPMNRIRRQLRSLLTSEGLQRFRGISTVMEWFDREDVTTHALLELVGFALVPDCECRYRLLEEGDPYRRAGIIRDELTGLLELLVKADKQSHASWPKGLSWN